MSSLEKAIQIAVLAHTQQKDRFGRPYILHPLRMLVRLDTEAEQIVAALHDVLEKSHWTLRELKKEGFAPEILAAVECLTKREGEPYLEYIRRARVDPLARRVKAADLHDHLKSLKEHGGYDSFPDRAARYNEAFAELNKGNSEGM